MRQHDDVGLRFTLIRLFLQHGVDGYVQIGKNARDIRQHTRLVVYAQPQVIRGFDLAHRQNRNIGQLIGLKCQMRHAMLRISRHGARDINQICNDCRGSRLCACACAVEHGLADGIAFDQNGVHHTFNIRDQALGGNQCGMHAQFNTVGLALGNAQQLDTIAEVFRVLNILACEFGNTFGVGGRKLHRNTKADSGHDGELVSSINAFDIKRGISFSVTQRLRFFQHIIKACAFFTHLGQNKVRGAIDNARNPLNAIGCQPLAQRFDNGHTTRHSRFKRDHHAIFLRGGEYLVAVLCQQRLVRGNDMLSIRNSF